MRFLKWFRQIQVEVDRGIPHRLLALSSDDIVVSVLISIDIRGHDLRPFLGSRPQISAENGSSLANLFPSKEFREKHLLCLLPNSVHMLFVS